MASSAERHFRPKAFERGRKAPPVPGCGAVLAWGVGNLAVDPLLTGTQQLGAGSECIDAADNLRVPPDWLDLDGDGICSQATLEDSRSRNPTSNR